MSKSLPAFATPCAVHFREHFGQHTACCFSKQTCLDGQIQRKKRKRSSDERQNSAKKRSRNSKIVVEDNNYTEKPETSEKSLTAKVTSCSITSSTNEVPLSKAPETPTCSLGAAQWQPSALGLLEGPTSPGSLEKAQNLTSADVFKKGSKRRNSSAETEERSRKRSRTSPHEDPSLTDAEAASSSSCNSDGMNAFEAKYEQQGILGRGGFSFVFAGFRKKDNVKVAIKHVMQKDIQRVPNILNKTMSSIPLEVALLIKVGAGPDATKSSVTPVLLDWFDLEDKLIMVFERPDPCMDLVDYMKSKCKRMPETEAKVILKQLVDAAIKMHSRGVFHRDIKLDNILIEQKTDVPRVRFIDFGCGTTCNPPDVFTLATGTRYYIPPEMFQRGFYMAEPTTVWQLGVVLYALLHMKYPFVKVKRIVKTSPLIAPSCSDDCKDFLMACLTKKPELRISLESLRDHPWLN